MQSRQTLPDEPVREHNVRRGGYPPVVADVCRLWRSDTPRCDASPAFLDCSLRFPKLCVVVESLAPGGINTLHFCAFNKHRLRIPETRHKDR